MTFATYDNQLEELELQLEAMDRAQLAALFANHRLALSKYSKGWLEAAEAAASEERKAATLRRLQAQVDRIQERWLKHQQRIRTERESILGDVQRLLESCAMKSRSSWFSQARRWPCCSRAAASPWRIRTAVAPTSSPSVCSSRLAGVFST